MNIATQREAAYVSTGSLPPAQQVIALVDEAYEAFRTNREGETSDVYPALRRVAPDQFGICVVSVAGKTYAAGDTDVEF
ncbi:MAG: glutaminase, partial [Dehalococcoidia bacterium]